MRTSRFFILSQPSGIVHLFWRCHNREYLLDRPRAKGLFFQSLIFGLKHRGSFNSVKLHAFCLMSNHVHQQMSYENGVQKLSHVMRVAHGLFGRLFNNAFKRSGKVANERPKTSLIGDPVSQMKVHFYIEANPVRAGMVKLEKLRFYFWNSYRFYAYGEVDEWTSAITAPQWYLELGTTPEVRQKAYRNLFQYYLNQTVLVASQFLKRFIGTEIWVQHQELGLKKVLESRARLKLLSGPD